MQQITAFELAENLKTTKVQLVDVREPHEWQQAHIAGAKHIPLGQLPDRLAELRRGEEVVCYCKMGGRSANACVLLSAAGFASVTNLEGGIVAWRRDVDPTMPPF
jgi:rhodanese-related sulfurtransferase